MKYFTIKEMTESSTATKKGIKNIPSALEEKNLILLIEKILDPLRESYGKPIVVTSGYRSKELNLAIKGSNTSQHLSGQAVDIRSVSDSKEENKKIFELIRSLELPFDLLINEYDYDWVHVSYSNRNRRLILNIK